jgi:hypothetical protein
MAYDVDFKLKALELWARNGGDADKTEAQLQEIRPTFNKRSLYRWKDDPDLQMLIDTKMSQKSLSAYQGAGEGRSVVSRLEETIDEMLAERPKLTGRDWSVGLGILLDKLIALKSIEGGSGGEFEEMVRIMGALPPDQRRALRVSVAEFVVDGTSSVIS